MTNKLYKHKSRITAETQYLFQRLVVKLRVEPSGRFLCHRRGRRWYTHSVRMVSITDLPCPGNEVKIELVTPQIRCPKCGRFHTQRPDFALPTMGFTWRFMQHISSLPVYVPARRLAEMYGFAPSTALRIDKEVLKRRLPPPNLDGIQGLLADEKYPDPSFGFVALIINARTGEPLHMGEALHMAKGKDGVALESFFKLLTDKQKRSIIYPSADRANAYRATALKHLPWVKICYDAYHLTSNMNEVVDKVRRVEM